MLRILKQSAMIFVLLVVCSQYFAYAQTDTQTYIDPQIQYKINTLQNQIQNTYQKVYTGKTFINDMESRLNPIKIKINTLKDHLVTLDEEYKLSQKQLQEVQKQMSVKAKEVSLLQEQLKTYEKETAKQKQVLLELGPLIYNRQKEYLNFGDETKLNTVKLLFANSAVSELGQSNNYLRNISEVANSILNESKNIRDKEYIAKQLLEEKKIKFGKLKEKIELQKKIVATQKESKKLLISFTQGSEEAYQDLLSKAREEQENIFKEIKSYQSEFASIEELLNKSGGSQKISTAELEWPVDPSRGISSHYLDNDYEKLFGIPHPAIDVRAAQGTPIMAPADGYVFKVRDGGEFGYSYIIMVHRNKYTSLFGHVSEAFVKEGQIVSAGEMVGLTGGTPGTHGAGPLTTGPHLHWEVFKNGDHIDPTTVVDLSELSKP